MKKILILLTILLSANINAFAEVIPIKITPAEKISTCYNEVQLGDNIKFKVVNAVYQNNKVYIAKDSIVIGRVDFLDSNGFIADNARIDFKTFKVRDINNKLITFDSPLSINGFEILKYKTNRKAQFFNYCGVVFRGKEIEIDPEKEIIIFNIWLNSAN